MAQPSEKRILDKICKSVETYDSVLMEKSLKEAFDAGIPPGDIMASGLGKGMEAVGKKFDAGRIFLPQVMAASAVVNLAMEKLSPFLDSDDKKYRGTVVMGSVQGDIHEIGKNVCCAMLRGAGYKVIDLGSDVSPYSFIEAAKSNSADIIAGSALMTTTLQMQKAMVKAADEEKYSVLMIFGGAPCTKEWVKSIGGDGYSSSGAEIVKLVESLLGDAQ